MVAKINYGSSVYGAVTYNHEKVENGKASVITYNKMYTNVRDGINVSFANVLRSFDDYLTTNSRVEKPVTHFSLNPDPNDNLSEEQLISIAHEYMGKMGYKDQPYIVYKHNDIDREHIHIVTIRIDENGKKISDRFDYKRSMDACRDIENNYNLTKVEKVENINHAPGYTLKPVDISKGDLKRQISNVLGSLIHDYKFQSLGEYNALLSCFNIHSKYVKGEEQGNIYHGIVYNATDDSGKLVVNPVKSSRIGKSVGFQALTIIMKETSDKIKNEKVPFKSKGIIAKALKSSDNKSDFISKLNNQGVNVIFRTNEDGRIYGVTFVDHANKIVFNGSRLGKEFSANVLNELFTQTDNKLFVSNEVPAKKDAVLLDNKPVYKDFTSFAIEDSEEIAFNKRKSRKKKGLKK